MSLKTGGFFCRAPAGEVRAAIGKLLASAPKAAVPDTVCLEEHAGWTAVGIQGWAFGHSEDWARLVSAVTGGPAVGFCLLEGTNNYSVYDGGEYVGGQRSLSERDPVLVGDLERMASLLGVSDALLRQHCVGNPLSDVYAAADEATRYRLECATDYLDDFRTRPSHRFAPWDEYAYVNLLQDLGFIEFGLADPETIEATTDDPRPWSPSAAAEPSPAHTFDPVAFRAQHGIRIPTRSELDEVDAPPSMLTFMRMAQQRERRRGLWVRALSTALGGVVGAFLYRTSRGATIGCAVGYIIGIALTSVLNAREY